MPEESELREQRAGGAEQGEIVAASVAQGVARIDPRARIQPRDQAVFSVDVERMHFVDPDTGDAIAAAAPALTAPAPSVTPA